MNLFPLAESGAIVLEVNPGYAGADGERPPLVIRGVPGAGEKRLLRVSGLRNGDPEEDVCLTSVSWLGPVLGARTGAPRDPRPDEAATAPGEPVATVSA